MFDIGLTNPFKSSSRKKKIKQSFLSIIALFRHHKVHAIISSWVVASGIKNHLSAARSTRIHQIDPDVVLNSHFIFQHNDQQMDPQTKRDVRRNAILDVNCNILTESEMMNVILENLQEQERYSHFCVMPP